MNTETKHTPTPRIILKGKRGGYTLHHNGMQICAGSNKERMRGIQYFLEAHPQCLSALAKAHEEA